MLFGKCGYCRYALFTVKITVFHYAFNPNVNGEWSRLVPRPNKSIQSLTLLPTPLIVINAFFASGVDSDFIYSSVRVPLLNLSAASIIYLSRKPERITDKSSFEREYIVSVSGNGVICFAHITYLFSEVFAKSFYNAFDSRNIVACRNDERNNSLP